MADGRESILIHDADSRQIAIEAAVAPVDMADGRESARSNHELVQ